MIKLIGIPYDTNSSFLKGPALAPERIRLMGLEGSANAFSESGIEVKENLNYLDLGDILFDSMNSPIAFDLIQSNISGLIREGGKIISLGGDHSISFPIIDSFTQKNSDLNILQLDAHADLYEDFEGNPFSHASPFARLMERGRVSSLTQVGIRTLNTHQREQAQKFGVNIIEMKDFTFDFLHSLRSPLYISLDMDVLDPAFAPGVSHHEPGGMQTRQLLKIIQNIPCEIVGADIVEYNPVRDHHNMTAMVAYKMFKELVAGMISASNEQ